MPPFKSRYESPYHCLGIKASASESEIRSAYRVLALQLHPDKVGGAEREDATSQFQELQFAYEICLKRLRNLGATVQPDWDYDSEADDSGNFRGGNYDDGESTFWGAGQQPIFGQEWWDNLTEDDPAPLRNWAKACKRAHRNSRRQMTDTERVILNVEFATAQGKYETWRRQQEAIEQRKHKETQLNERERRNAQSLQSQKQEGNEEDGWDKDGYEDGLDDEEYLKLWECQDEQFQLKPQTGTWRDSAPNKTHTKQSRSAAAANKAAKLRLENFQHQIHALEDRLRTSGAQENIDPTQKSFMRRKAKLRNATAAQLQKEAQEDDGRSIIEQQIEKKLAFAKKEAKKKGLELDYRNIPGVENGGLFEEATLNCEIGSKRIDKGQTQKKTKALDAVPENWEDEME